MGSDKGAQLLGQAQQIFGVGQSAADALGGVRDKIHGSTTESDETRSIEFDVNLDLGVRNAGEQVSTGVSIVGDALDSVDKIIPVKTAVQFVEKAIANKVKQIITDWAKEKVKGKVGIDVDQVKETYDVGKKTLIGGFAKASDALSSVT